MTSPVICGEHDYLGFEPCPRCSVPSREIGRLADYLVKSFPEEIRRDPKSTTFSGVSAVDVAIRLLENLRSMSPGARRTEAR